MASLLFAFSSIFGFPWLTAAVPLVPLHTMSLGEVDAVSGNVTDVVETRIPAVVSSAAIALTILAVPFPLAYIPVPCLYGTLLFLASSSLDGNSLF